MRSPPPPGGGGNQAHFDKEDKPQLQQQIGAFWSVLLSGNQMRHYSKEGDKGLWIGKVFILSLFYLLSVDWPYERPFVRVV